MSSELPTMQITQRARVREVLAAESSPFHQDEGVKVGTPDRVWGREHGRTDRLWRLIPTNDGFQLSTQAVEHQFSGTDC